MQFSYQAHIICLFPLDPKNSLQNFVLNSSGSYLASYLMVSVQSSPVKLKNALCCISSSLTVFTSWCLIKYRDKFILHFPEMSFKFIQEIAKVCIYHKILSGRSNQNKEVGKSSSTHGRGEKCITQTFTRKLEFDNSITIS